MHYVVSCDSAEFFEQKHRVLAVKHSFEEAEVVFRARVELERSGLEERGWTIFCDTANTFDCGIDGDYDCAHVLVWIAEVEE